jgi:signal transduction histidine kinase
MGLGLVVTLLILLETQGLVRTLHAQTQVRDRIAHDVREAVLAAYPRLAAALRPGGASAWIAAADEALAAALASEVEVFDRSGQQRLARPAPSPIVHWPRADELASLEGGGVLVVGPITQGRSRLLTYAALLSGGEMLVLRLSTPVTGLLEDLRERRESLFGHGVALVLLALGAALVLSPWQQAMPSSPKILDAYEEAMGRLKDRGEQLSREHEAERRRMEEEIHEKDAMARAGELTAGIAHEVRNGLGTMLGYARLIDTASAAPEVREAAGHIVEECEVLENVVRRFVDFVKRETLNLASFEVNRLLSRVVAHESRGSQDPEIDIAPAPSVSLVGDEELLERALENLLRNAREAAGPGGHVHVGLRSEQGTVTITVSDDGPGLPAGAPRTPRPFATSKAGGLGLGLPLAHKVIRLHRGALELMNRSPRGLMVTVTLPTEGP